MAGRGFNAGDTETSPNVVLVSETMARQLWPGWSVLSLRVRVPNGGRASSGPGARASSVIRMVVGAQRDDVLLIPGWGLTLAGWVLGIDLVLALGTTRLMSTLLFEIGPTDPFTFAVITVLLGTAACYVPVSRVLELDPLEALRCDQVHYFCVDSQMRSVLFLGRSEPTGLLPWGEGREPC